MDHELLDQKGDYFMDRDDNFSSLKHEFSKIFHENNLQSFTNASDIGFLELGQLASHGYPADYEEVRGLGDVENLCSRPYQKDEVSPYMGMGMHHPYSPIRFLQSNLGPNNGYNTNFQGLGGLPQKFTPVQDSAYYQYPGYKYADYMDYPPQANNMFGQNIYDLYNQSDLLDTQVANNPLSMMWSNEVNKGTSKKTSLTSEELLQPSQNVSNKKFNSASPNQHLLKKEESVTIEQDFAKVSNKSLELQMERAGKSGPEINSAGLRRTNRITKPLFTANMIHDDDDEEDYGSDDEKDGGYKDGKSRSSRGLRVLSLKVRDIVSKKKKTSYKEVAEALLQDLNQKMKGKSQHEIAKEEQNVKRRVYDALNVLIAASVLRKEGKLVCCENSNPYSTSQNKKAKVDKAALLEQLREMKARRKEKIEALQELVFKSLAVKNLIRKNREKEEEEIADAKLNGMRGGAKNKKTTAMVNATRIDIVQENPALKTKTQDVIRFPFIVLVSSSSENSMNLNMDSTQKQLSIESRKPFNIFGDIDVLLKMRLHYVPRQIFEKEIPKDLQRYMAQSFIDELK